MTARHHYSPTERARLRAHGIYEHEFSPPAEVKSARRWLQRQRVMALCLGDAPALAHAANAAFSSAALIQAVILDGWPDGRGDPAFKPLIAYTRTRFNIRPPIATEPDPPRQS